MGAKTALLAFAEGDLRPALRGAGRSDPAEAIDLVRELHPGYEVTPLGDGSLGDDFYPPDDTTYATVLAGAELFCDRRLVYDRPSQLPVRLHQAGAGFPSIRWSWARRPCAPSSASSSRACPVRTTSIRSTFTCTVSGSPTRPAGSRRTARPR